MEFVRFRLAGNGLIFISGVRLIAEEKEWL